MRWLHGAGRVVGRPGWVYAILLGLGAVFVFATGSAVGYLVLLGFSLPCSLIIPAATFLTGAALQWLPGQFVILAFGVEVFLPSDAA